MGIDRVIKRKALLKEMLNLGVKNSQNNEELLQTGTSPSVHSKMRISTLLKMRAFRTGSGQIQTVSYKKRNSAFDDKRYYLDGTNIMR